MSGAPHAPPSPLDRTDATFTPSAATDLFMGSGDVLAIDIHDGAAGLTAIVHDLTTGQTGSMTASAANGFAQVLYEPTSATCHQAPYTFRPMYATSSEHTRVPWAAHTYNVAFSDEIGHFEYCNAVADEGGDCTEQRRAGLDDDDTRLLQRRPSRPSSRSEAVSRTDNDFDGSSYQPVWPGADPNRGQDKKYHPSSILFTSPLFNGTQNYSRVAFEADLPRIEAADFGGICNRFTGTELREPPAGVELLSDLHDRRIATEGRFGRSGASASGSSAAPNMKGTTNTFGGNSAAEFGPLLFSFYPNPDPAVRMRTNNFRNVLGTNPCPA